MSVSRLRQDQIHSVGASINDTLSPTNHDANAVDLQDTLDYIASQLKTITGNATWEAAPELSIAGINAKTFLDEKLAIRELQSLVAHTVASGVKASGSFVAVAKANLIDGETFTIDDGVNTPTVFEFDLPPDGVTGGRVAVNVSAAVSAVQVASAMVAAINGVGATLFVTADNAGGTSATVTVTHDHEGTVGNVSTWAETVADIGFTITQPTGGSGDVVNPLAANIPSYHKAVGAGTTQGLISATLGTYGSWSLAVVSGDNVLNPKNMIAVIDSTTHDPVLDSDGRVVWGLLQNETGATSGAFFTDTTPERAQVSFVVISTGGTALTHPPQGIAGKTVHFIYPNRTVLDSWTEQDFMKRSAFVDIPQAAAIVNLDNAIDNQGATPATQATNVRWQVADGVTLDFENGAGDRDLIRLAPAVAGDVVQVNVDSLDVNVGAAGTIDFDNGMTVDSGGTPLNLGVTAGTVDASTLTIDSTSGTLTLDGNNGVAVVGNASEIDLTTTANVDVNAGMSVTIDSADSSNFTMAANAAGNKQLLIAARNAGAGTADLKLEADENVIFETAQQTAGINLDDATAGPIGSLFGQSFASVSAAIAYAGTIGGADLAMKLTVLSSSYAAGVNVPAATLNLTTYTLDMSANAATVFVFLNGRLLRGAASSGSGDVYPGTTPASGDLKHDFTKPLLSGDVLISVGLKQ